MKSKLNSHKFIVSSYIVSFVLILIVAAAFAPHFIKKSQREKAEAVVELLKDSQLSINKNFQQGVALRNICFDGRFNIDYCNAWGELKYDFEAYDIRWAKNPIRKVTITTMLRPTFEEDTVLWHCLFLDNYNIGKVYGFDCEIGVREIRQRR